MESPTELQLDALREVTNIGVGQAASALSRLVGGRAVRIDVPRAHVADRSTLPSLLEIPSEPLLVASFEVLGELWGQLLMVMTQADARRLARLLTGSSGNVELERSALSEAGNIVASACLSAIGDLARMTLLPSIPAVVEQVDGALLLEEALHEVEAGPGLGVVLEARFVASTELPVSGQILMVPALSSVKRLLQRLGV